MGGFRIAALKVLIDLVDRKVLDDAAIRIKHQRRSWCNYPEKGEVLQAAKEPHREAADNPVQLTAAGTDIPAGLSRAQFCPARINAPSFVPAAEPSAIHV